MCFCVCDLKLHNHLRVFEKNAPSLWFFLEANFLMFLRGVFGHDLETIPIHTLVICCLLGDIPVRPRVADTIIGDPFGSPILSQRTYDHTDPTMYPRNENIKCPSDD